jgi:glutaminase
MVEQALESGEHDMDQVLDIATLMKEFGMLSNKVLKQVSLSFAQCKMLTSQ